jgi:hypothetical protein
MAKKLGIFLVVLLLAGGAFFAWRRLRPKQVQFAVTVEAPTYAASEMIVAADGRELARSRDKAAVTFSLAGHPGRDFTPEMVPRFSARLLLPCGWRDAKVKFISEPSPVEMQNAAKAGRPVYVTLTVTPPDSSIPSVTLWVDNREHGEVRLAVGQQERIIPANTKGDFNFGWDPACSGALEVKLDGARVGELPAEIRSGEGGEEYDTRDVRYSSEFLVDTSGKRCYSFNEFCYAPPGKGSNCFFPMEPTFYRPAVLHHLPTSRPDFFLEELPKTIRVERGEPLPAGNVDAEMDMELRTRLHQVGCG